MPFVYALTRLSSTDAENDASVLERLPPFVLILLALGCLVLAACVAGLTLGLMTLDTMGLQIIMQSNNRQHANAARVIGPIRQQGNLLLVTLLFTNALATELLPLVLEALIPGGYFSLIVSVGSIMVFGEIIPQAICSRHPLLIGSKMIGFVKVLRTIMYPLAAPIAYLLDVFLGEELGTVYDRGELKGLIDVHLKNSVLTQDETTILKATLEFSRKTVHQILTPAKNVFKLNIDTLLDRDTLLSLLRSGHSRVPLYDGSPNNIVCLLLVKQLILVNPDDALPIRSLISKRKRNHKIRVAPALECSSSTLIADLLNEFQKGRSHMSIVYDNIANSDEDRQFLGIVSIEDIIEEILHEEIIDETDAFIDNTNSRKVLVRNAEGRLVHTVTHKTQTLHQPGDSSAVVLKEIDVQSLRKPLDETIVGSKIRADWKKPQKSGKRRVTMAPVDSLSETPMHSADVEQGLLQASRSKSDDEQLADFNAANARYQSGRTSHEDIRYALLPGQSAQALFEEDDGIIPEDVASLSTSTGSQTTKALKNTLEREDDPEVTKKLHMRPLPEDASSERLVKLPERAGIRSNISTVQGSSSYGSVDNVRKR